MSCAKIKYLTTKLNKKLKTASTDVDMYVQTSAIDKYVYYLCLRNYGSILAAHSRTYSNSTPSKNDGNNNAEAIGSWYNCK